MLRNFEIETSETDEKALLHVHMADKLEFSFSSWLKGFINSAREQYVRDAREQAAKTGEFLPVSEESIIANFALKTADERHAETLARLAEEQAERERIEAEKAAELAAQEAERKRLEDERIKAAVAAALAERDANEADGN